jgi:hypothetical protein
LTNLITPQTLYADSRKPLIVIITKTYPWGQTPKRMLWQKDKICLNPWQAVARKSCSVVIIVKGFKKGGKQ